MSNEKRFWDIAYPLGRRYIVRTYFIQGEKYESKNRPINFVLIVLSAVALWQFSHGVRAVDVVGLFAGGALAGVALSGFFMARK